MKRIIINGRFLTQRITGVQRCAREICLELDKLIKPGELTIAIPPDTNDIPDYKNIRVIQIGRFHNRLWEQISFPIYVLKEKAIPLNLCNVAPLLFPGCVFMYDMKIHAHPEFFSSSFRLWYRINFYNSIKRARIIFTDSNFTKSEIVKYYPSVDNSIIHVIYLGWQHFKRINYDENTLAKYGLEKDLYYFAMSSLEPNKNFKWIADQAVKNSNDLYVVAGSINKKVFSDGLGFRCPDNMKLIGYVSDEEAKTLMRDCKAFLFPSIYEGFGLPPLEAIGVGAKSVIVSDIPVMHEVFEDNVMYISILKNNIKKTRKLLDKYNWEKASSKLLRVLRQNIRNIKE